MDNSAINYTKKVFVLVLLTAQLGIITQVELIEASIISSGGGEFRAVGPTEYRVVEGNGEDGVRRRQLAPFQLCLVCKCCSSATNCATMPCCFAIDCQLPNKPFGVCAFVPKSCNCTSCPV